jgi:hypothetical protein
MVKKRCIKTYLTIIKEARINGRKDRIKSWKARREKRTFREIYKMFLCLKPNEQMMAKFTKLILYLDVKNVTI